MCLRQHTTKSLRLLLSKICRLWKGMVINMDEKEKVFTLEENFKQLEEMIEKLEDKEIGLEESFSLYEQGMKLLKQCNDQIDRVEKKVMVMNQNGALDEFS